MLPDPAGTRHPGSWPAGPRAPDTTLGRREEALRELQAAAKGAEGLGNPSGLWRARADLGHVLEVTGDDAGAEEQLRLAAGIIRDMATRLSADRARRFLDAPPVAEVLHAIHP